MCQNTQWAHGTFSSLVNPKSVLKIYLHIILKKLSFTPCLCSNIIISICFGRTLLHHIQKSTKIFSENDLYCYSNRVKNNTEEDILQVEFIPL